MAVSTPLRAWPAFLACALALAERRRRRADRARDGPAARVIVPLVVFVAAFVPFVAASAGPGRPGGALGGRPRDVRAGHRQGQLIGALGAVLLGATAAFPDLRIGLVARAARRGC